MEPCAAIFSLTPASAGAGRSRGREGEGEQARPHGDSRRCYLQAQGRNRQTAFIFCVGQRSGSEAYRKLLTWLFIAASCPFRACNLPFLRPNFGVFYNCRGNRTGVRLLPARQFAAAAVAIAADRRGVFWCPLRSFGGKAPGESPHNQAQGPSSSRHLPRRGRARPALLADGAVEGRALARDLHRGEASRRRAFADRAERKYRGRIRRPAWRAALFLVRRSRFARRGHLAGDARAQRRLRRLQDGHAQHRGAAQRAAEAGQGKRRLAGARCLGSRHAKISIRRGSRSCSMRRSTKSRRGARCMTCCGTSRATCSSTPWVCARTRRAKSFSRTAPTFPISCAPISPSRWGCRSAIRNARAATAARRRNARSGGTSRTRSPLPRRPGG